MRRVLFSALVVGTSLVFIGPTKADLPAAPDFAEKYRLVFGQDFSKMTDIAELKAGGTDMGSGIWISHTPLNQDWFTFQDPSGANHPFGVGQGYLTIRVQKDGHDPKNSFAGYSGGLLSSMDGKGKGFAQQYGYFEASMMTPGSPNTWPAFWMMSSPSLTDRKLNSAELDVTESYGNYDSGPGQKPPGKPTMDTFTWHVWKGTANGGAQISWGASKKDEPGMTTGFHTYGLDVEPDEMTWYFDRKPIWKAKTFAEAKEPLFVMLNLALGGGNHNNAGGTDYDWSLTPDPSDLKIKYVAVWASPHSPNFKAVSQP
jgi:beta-glucanase (GH16 family)